MGRKIFRFAAFAIPLVFVALLVGACFAPCEDYQGRCTVCGLRVYEKRVSFLSEPIRLIQKTKLSRFYEESGLPAHEHRWEYMGGTVKTNLYGYPTRYEFERSDPLLLVPDYFLIEVLRRLEFREAQKELLRGLNCDDEGVRETVREHLYAAYPNGMGSFMRWWEEYITGRQGQVPSAVLPGPMREKRLEESGESAAGNPDKTEL